MDSRTAMKTSTTVAMMSMREMSGRPAMRPSSPSRVVPAARGVLAGESCRVSGRNAKIARKALKENSAAAMAGRNRLASSMVVPPASRPPAPKAA